MGTWFHNNLIWTEGAQIVLILVGLAVAGLLFYRPLFYATLALFFFTFYFFRNPDRVCPQALTDPSVLICPADGKVVDLQYNAAQNLSGFTQKVSIFLSPIDVHVNWLPIAGTITDIRYTPGQFTFAFVPKSSLLNEHNDLYITAADGKQIMVRQIAGMIARRICCWVDRGQLVKVGQKFGMIRFGSRVDIFLPTDVELAVGVGQRVYGGQTVLGRWK